MRWNEDRSFKRSLTKMNWEGQDYVIPTSFRSKETGQDLSISTSRGGSSHNSQFKTLYVQKYSGTLKRTKPEDLRGRFRFQIHKINFH